MIPLKNGVNIAMKIYTGDPEHLYDSLSQMWEKEGEKQSWMPFFHLVDDMGNPIHGWEKRYFPSVEEAVMNYLNRM